MFTRIILSAFLVLSVAGCAAGKFQDQTQQLKQQIANLQSEMEEKDKEIYYLESELERTSKRQSASSDLTKPASYQPLSPKQIQRVLRAAGFYDGSIDGKIGKETKSAIVAFQKDKGLKADGIVGKSTTAELRKFLE